jgi:peroxiredoxin
MKITVWTATFALALSSVGTAQLSEGDTAPVFDISSPLQTGIKKFKDLKGKVVLLDFFTTT